MVAISVTGQPLIADGDRLALQYTDEGLHCGDVLDLWTYTRTGEGWVRGRVEWDPGGPHDGWYLDLGDGWLPLAPGMWARRAP
ncbi:MAG: DUF5348 domain-containing protein [Steroidobacteraceae bacterium]